MTTYPPNPIDTSDVQLNPSLHQLMEELAKNTHDVWAQQRIAQGWVYGLKRDDTQKHHPDLLPYEDLTDGEKQYDRETARETLKAILKIGYKIIDPASTSNSKLEEEAEMTRQLIDRCRSIKELLSLWHQKSLDIWNAYPDLFLTLGKAVKRVSEPLLAYDILSEGVKSLGGVDALHTLSGPVKNLAVSLCQQEALALANCGATSDANAILQAMQGQGVLDSETMGILGRTWKDLAQHDVDTDTRQKLFLKSYETYHQGFTLSLADEDLDGAYYNGINAATMALLSQQKEECLKMTEQVKAICLESIQLQTAKDQDIGYWLYATMGEAHLLEQKVDKAFEWYTKAAEVAGKTSKRALGSMRCQARMILKALQLDEASLDDCFQVPSVTLFSGHMFDRADRQESRFPVHNEAIVRKRIRQWLEDVNAGIGYASAACGADIIFLEELMSRGAEAVVILPFDTVSFRKVSVDFLDNEEWAKRFDTVLKQATEVKVLSEYHPETMLGDFLFTNIYMYGRAVQRAQHAAAELHPLLVWDGKIGDGIGGTASMANILSDCDINFTVIPPDGSYKKGITEYFTKNEKQEKPVRQSVLYGNRIKLEIDRAPADYHVFLPLLFADVKGYSKLNEKQALRFATQFMGEMADVLTEYDSDLLGRRTQGDSLFLVFKTLQACVDCARDLNGRIDTVDWTRHRLPADLSMRISLDAGPGYSYTDPVTSRTDFCGDYVVRAARLEPVTPPGSIYASETFVAVATTLDVQGVKFDYAGQVELPKGHGMLQAFCVGRTNNTHLQESI